LAAAFAASGRHAEAVEIAEVAADLTGEAELESRIRARLERYRRGEAYTSVRRAAGADGSRSGAGVGSPAR
jgi:hypothetical protein